MKINQIWDELINDSSSPQGFLFRRFSGSVLPDIFVALKQPERQLCIACSLSESVAINIAQYENLQEVQIELISARSLSQNRILIFKLLNNQHRDIFSVLCEDLISSISYETNEKQLVKTLLNRFEKWKSLFTRITLEGLQPEEQRGLYGELFFLRKFLLKNVDYTNLLNTWKGTTRDIRDFQMNNWALEVKTTHGNNHQKVQISNERQLDTTNVGQLFLYHISLEKLQGSGETLNQIVSAINGILITDMIALNRFRSKLYEAGYFEQHTSLYDSTGYVIRKDTFYLVEKEFPRIEENELRPGIGDVKYSIILSQCENYKQTEEFVFENLLI